MSGSSNGLKYQQLVSELGLSGIQAGEELRCRCPFHKDQNPSFSVNLRSGLFICFGCNERGDFLRLVEMIMRFSPQEAYSWISDNSRRMSVESLSSQLASELGQIPGHPLLQDSWHEHYFSCTNKVMPLWFLKRGFNWSTVNHWGIRYDQVQDAIVIPAFWQEELVGTITRVHTGAPKYRNSLNFPKSEILFGEIFPNQISIILCEGVLDVIWLNQNHLSAFALLGTQISERQIELLKQFRVGEIVLALDADEAGKKGTLNLVHALTRAHYLLPQLSIMNFPEGTKDPQDLTSEQLLQVFQERKGFSFDF